jgi:hypothetical protein
MIRAEEADFMMFVPSLLFRFSPDDNAIAAEADFDLRIGVREWRAAGNRVAYLFFSKDKVADPVGGGLGRGRLVLGSHGRSDGKQNGATNGGRKRRHSQIFCLH